MTASQPFDLRLPTPGCHNDPERVGLDAKGVFDGMTEHLFFTLGKLASTASRHDLYMALSYAVRDRLMVRPPKPTKHDSSGWGNSQGQPPFSHLSVISTCQPSRISWSKIPNS